MAVFVSVVAYWIVLPRSPVVVYKFFEETCCMHIQGFNVPVLQAVLWMATLEMKKTDEPRK
jgi:hypothetical protein